MNPTAMGALMMTAISSFLGFLLYQAWSYRRNEKVDPALQARHNAAVAACNGIAPQDGEPCALAPNHPGEHSHVGPFRNRFIYMAMTREDLRIKSLEIAASAVAPTSVSAEYLILQAEKIGNYIEKGETAMSRKAEKGKSA